MSVKIARKPDVCERGRFSPSTLDRMVSRGEFPRPMKLSPRLVGWREEVVDRWFLDREAASAEGGSDAR